MTTDSRSTAGSLDGRVVVVTGGNRGIGLGMARGLATAGATVSIWGTDRARSESAAAEVEALGATAHVARCDVSDEAEVQAAFASVLATCGGVDTVFANAGVAAVPTLPWKVSTQEWRRVQAVNYDGAFFTLREAARILVEQGRGGSLVAVSSTSAIHGAPTTAAYAASKTGVLGLVRSFAVALARHDVRVNALLPGWTDTDMMEQGKAHERFVANTLARTPMRRWADPSDYASAAVFLADPTNRFHTGDTVVIDGGYTVF